MAAYVLIDWPIMQALTRAADRGVAIRIYLDGTQLAEREPAKVFRDLAETPGVEIALGSQFIAMPARFEFADLAHIAFPLAGRSGTAAMALAGALR
jgi:phosphatidylserine/phosphatidylglycerophosphate/cardiolipin synthase-like enzyme